MLIALAGLSAIAAANPQTEKADGAIVRYDGISAAQAKALAETIAAARQVYARELGFEMPETVTLTVSCGPGQPTRLFTDGRDHVSLSMPSSESLAKPAKSGTFHLYGLCHELGHVAMYRTLKERAWLTTPGAEGWAHYAGSVVVDHVYATKGERLWPDPYDYRADGTARLARQLAAASPDEVTRGARLWQELAAIVGVERMPKVFAAWQGANADPASPSKRLLETLVATHPEKKDALESWWIKAAPLLVRDRPASGFRRVEIAAAKLEGKPLAAKADDDAPDGKRSIAGGGHARSFQVPADGGEWYLRAVFVHGGRYGPVAPPADTFDLALCDADMKPIAVWKHPYKTFERGQPKWVRIETPPTLLPATFNVCVVFRPTAQNGVFVSYDASTNGSSRVATPGAAGNLLKQGDWMIRVEFDRPKAADALRGQ